MKKKDLESISQMIYSEQTARALIENHATNIGFVDHQLSSFSHLINQGLQRIIQEESEISVEVDNKPGMAYTVKFGALHVERPDVIEEDRRVRSITPAEARLREHTYDGALAIDINTTLTLNGVVTETKNMPKVVIGRMPIMTQSCKCNLYGLSPDELVTMGECKEDTGGYFIIKGKERVLIPQERAAYNHIGVYAQKAQSKYAFMAEVRSMSATTGHSVLIQTKIGKNGRGIVFSLPYIQQEIPVGVVFVALGFSLEDTLTLIAPRHASVKKLIRVIRNECKLTEQFEALQFIGKHAMHVISADKQIPYAVQILENEILPHMGVISHHLERGLFLATLVRKLLETCAKDDNDEFIRPQDDRDNIANKRFEVAGILIGSLFRSLFKRLIRSVTPLVQKRPDVSIALSRFNTITQGFRSCFGTGKWGVQKNSYIRQGVSQVLSRLTHGATLSHLRRMVIPVGKEGKNTAIRQLHGSQIFYICLYETPEGHSSGIVKNFSLTCCVTNGISSSLVKYVLEKSSLLQGVEEISEVYEAGDLEDIVLATRVFVNGGVMGVTKKPHELCAFLRHERDNDFLPRKEISISYDDIDDEIHIATDEGRLIRPLIPVYDQKLPEIDPEIPWHELVNSQVIKYRDPAELEDCVVAMTPQRLEQKYKYDFCEIHPSMMMGVCASIIPYPDHSQSPRNCYQAAMGKQALGVYSTTNSIRADTESHMLNNPQIPLVTTHCATLLGFDKLPSGQNVLVAIGAYTGFNQEDSVIMNQAFIQRGGFRVTTFKTTTHVEKKRGTSYLERICIPPLDIQKKSGWYGSLGADGIIEVGSKVKKGDILIGRVLVYSSKNGKNTEKDSSIVVKCNHNGVVDKVIVGTTPEGFKFYKVKIRYVRIPEVGDKFASRAAQKGTMGRAMAHEDMPFTDTGLVPDIIINPHCIPSRMTINQLIEALATYLAVETGNRIDATAFTSESTDIVGKIRSALQQLGLNPDGTHRMSNGFTGEVLDAEIYMGLTYYQRLKHMVSDKMHARSRGECQALTRQPLEGRSRDGGLRFGEMERDCVLSHGTASFLHERLLHQSDYFEVDVCAQCHQISNESYCENCKSDNIVKIMTPYAWKLLLHELMAMGLKIDLFADNINTNARLLANC